MAFTLPDPLPYSHDALRPLHVEEDRSNFTTTERVH